VEKRRHNFSRRKLKRIWLVGFSMAPNRRDAVERQREDEFSEGDLGWRGFRFDGGYRSLLGEEFAAAFVN
jgi:hypothetical protein